MRKRSMCGWSSVRSEKWARNMGRSNVEPQNVMRRSYCDNSSRRRSRLSDSFRQPFIQTPLVACDHGPRKVPAILFVEMLLSLGDRVVQDSFPCSAESAHMPGEKNRSHVEAPWRQNRRSVCRSTPGNMQKLDIITTVTRTGSIRVREKGRKQQREEGK